MALAVCDTCHACYEGRCEPTTPGSRTDMICIRREESKVDQSCTHFVAPSWVRFGFRGWRCRKGLSALAIFTTGGRVIDEWWEVKWICARCPSFSGMQRGRSGTARAPGLASASMTTRLGLSWNAGDLVGEPSPYRCQRRRLGYTTLTSMSTRLTPFYDPPSFRKMVVWGIHPPDPAEMAETLKF